MKKLSLIIFVIILGKFNYSFSQKALMESKPVAFDTAKVIVNVKMLTLNFVCSELDKSEIIEILDEPIDYKILKSKGFGPFIFIEFECCPISKKVSNHYSNTSFVIACNTFTEDIYRIKGFKINTDLFHFFRELEYYAFSGYGFKKSHFKRKKKFLQEFYVEKIDLGCVFDLYYKDYRYIVKYYSRDCAKPNKSDVDIYLESRF